MCAPSHAVTTLRGSSLWLGALSRLERTSLEASLLACGATVAAAVDTADWYVLPSVYERAKKLAVLAAIPAGRLRPLPYRTCVALARRG